MASGSNTSASLYVGELDKDVTEAQLFDVFRGVGPVLSIRVCRDAATRRSLGYAYVNFQNPLDAERALETLNFSKIKDKPCRIMWCRRDPSLRKSGAGNIFIKNLAKDIGNKALYDTFLDYGPILSCKVVMDKEGNSMGYGFVHFQDESAAEAAVAQVNGMLLNGQQVYVGKFERKERKLQSLQESFTNCYVKHFSSEVDETKLRKYFESFGEIQSLAVSRKDDGKPKGFAFVNYKNHESAVKAVEQANGAAPEGIVEEGKKLYVCRHQKKSEREHVKKLGAKERQQQYMKYTNLYVKNLDDSVTSEHLREVFAEFGQIMSCKVMTHSDTKASLGFGFVCFKDAEAANKAVQAMNGRIVSGKPLYVAIAQKKDARKAQLEIFYRSGRMGPMGAGGGPGAGIMGMPQMPPFGGMNMPFNQGGLPGGFPGNQMQRPMNMFPLGGGRNMMGQNPMMMNRAPQTRPQMPRAAGMPGGMYGQMRPPMPSQQPINRPMMQPMGRPQMADTSINPGSLALMKPEEQKNFLGERLFSRITQIDSTNAAKITGMLLEMDNSEIINLLDSPNLLQAKVQEAQNVLKEHH